MLGKQENIDAIKKVLKILPKAVWEAAIEAGEVSPLPKLILTVLKKLHGELKDVKPEERIELAKGLKEADLAELITAVDQQTGLQNEQGDALARILSGLAEYSELIKGIEPTLVELLNVTSRVETLPNEVLELVRDELAKERGEVVEKIEEIPCRTVDEQGKEDEQRRLTKFEEFENDYLKAVKQTYKYMELLGIPSYSQSHPIKAGFVSLSLDGGSYRGLPAESVLSEHPRLVVVGDAGAGKTTLMQWEAVRCADHPALCEASEHFSKARGQGNSQKPTIPFFIRLRNFKDFDGKAFPDHEKWVKRSVRCLTAPEPEGWLNSVLREGRALLILDGLDELPHDMRKEFWKSLQEFLRLHEALRFRVTSRPFRHDDEENKDQWNIPKDQSGAHVPEVTVMELTWDRIDELIERWHKAAVAAEEAPDARERTERRLEGYADGLKKKLRERAYSKMYELARTPFFCSAICLINSYRRQLLPKKRHELYKMLIDALLGLRNKERGIVEPPPYDSIDEDVWFRLHARLAFDMMTNGMEETDDGEYLVEIDRIVALEWFGGKQGYIESFSALRDRIEAEELLDYMVTRCGLLREPAKGRLDFRHRALQEYLAGSAAMLFGWCGQLVKEAHDDRWRDTVILSAGGYNVGDQDVKSLLEALLKRGEKDKVCFAVAVACLETAGAKVGAKTYDLVLEKLERLVPPRDSEGAKVLSAAGDRAVEALSYEAMSAHGVEAVRAAAEALRRIGSESSEKQLRRGYWELDETAVLAEVIQCINPLEVPAIIRGAEESKQLAVAHYARAYVKDLEPLKNLPGLESLDLSDCTELSNIDGLANLKQLRTLDLSRCEGVYDLTALAELVDLESLSLRCCERITDLSTLKGLKNLQTLDLANCAGIEDLSVLETLENLACLDLQGVPEAKYPVKILDSCRVGIAHHSIPKATARDGGQCPPYEIVTVAGVDLQMLWIPKGSFQMGGDGDDDEKPIHPVSLEGFWLSRYPVTQAQYEAIMEVENPAYFKGPDRPVECVSWKDAKDFCAKISEKTGACFYLPSEAQWEYACRAGQHRQAGGSAPLAPVFSSLRNRPGSESGFLETGKEGRQYCFGDDESELVDYAWYAANSNNQTHPVGMKKANDWGLYDMHGNVWEWVEDDWHESYEVDGEKAPKDGSPWLGEARSDTRVLRGGGFYDYADLCRCAYRYGSAPDITGGDVGFRLARTP